MNLSLGIECANQMAERCVHRTRFRQTRWHFSNIIDQREFCVDQTWFGVQGK